MLLADGEALLKFKYGLTGMILICSEWVILPIHQSHGVGWYLSRDKQIRILFHYFVVSMAVKSRSV